MDRSWVNSRRLNESWTGFKEVVSEGLKKIEKYAYLKLEERRIISHSGRMLSKTFKCGNTESRNVSHELMDLAKI